MLNARDILETITMIQDEHLDVRTITMGISLLDCCHSDVDVMCQKVYDKITRYAKDLVVTGEQIEKEFGIPIINKRISVTPAAMILASCEDKDAVKLAKTLERAAVACQGVEGAYSMHPDLEKYYDFSVFLDIDPEKQKARILKRNSPQFATRFFEEWIPLENKYFLNMNVKERCDICISV